MVFDRELLTGFDNLVDSQLELSRRHPHEMPREGEVDAQTNVCVGCSLLEPCCHEVGYGDKISLLRSNPRPIGSIYPALFLHIW